MQRLLSVPGTSAGLDLEIPATVSTREAWDMAADATGMDAAAMATRVAAQFRIQVANLAAAEPRALRLLPEALARKFCVFPIREDDRRLVVATADPADLDAEQALGFASSRSTVFEVSPPAEIEAAIDEHFSPNRVVEDLLANVQADLDDGVTVVEETAIDAVSTQDVESGPVVRLTNIILRDAVLQEASDIHIEPGRAGGLVRIRVDGVLRQYMQMPMPALIRVISRIKIIGRLDIADRLRPQDGRATIRVEGESFDLRISTVPTRDAEKVVVRILRSQTATSIDEIGLLPHELDRFRRALGVRDGIIFVTGPTGSGKTTTLYAAIRGLATGDVNVMTVEDPVEYELPGIAQIQIETRRNVTFASALRAILRQDPDIILVGEIRDLETAETAVQAAMTGHLVLATLHTNDAVSAVQRLEDLGLDRAAIAGSVRASIAQRLVRRICEKCRTAAEPGCEHCGQTGYRGRAPVIEVMLADGPFIRLLNAGAPIADLQRAAREGGMRTLREVAADLVAAGITRQAEVERVLGDRAVETSPAVESPHILLVDDDAINRTLARTLLSKSGFRISEAVDGREALDRLARGHDFSLVVLDLDMPRMRGDEVLGVLRRDKATASMPVVILTGSDHEDTEIQLMDAGADDYIRKPIDPPRFVARVKATLRRAGL
ncbi:MAG: Flp pilus assembly complex ATPase component TadA [Gemmatimonadetes bacterium]|nr:Flp pilus assembly complex ATPase component TadA [Gemmatimonadota bacterium]